MLARGFLVVGCAVGLGVGCSDGVDVREALRVDAPVDSPVESPVDTNSPDSGASADAADAPAPVDAGTGLQAIGWYRGLFVTNWQTIETGFDLRGTPIRVWSPGPDDSFTATEGVGGQRGDFAVRDIPPGPFWLHIGPWYLRGMPGQEFDIPVPRLGFPEMQWATPGTFLELSVSNLAPWQEGDELYLFSASGSTDLRDLFDNIDPRPSPGQTSLEGKVDLIGRYGKTPLVEGLIRGDEVSLVQMQTINRPEAMIRVAERSLRTSRLQMVAGATAELAGQMRTPIPASRLDVHWDPEALLIRARDGIPDLRSSAAELRFSATPGGVVGLLADSGGSGKQGALLISARSSPTAMPISFEYDWPFPQTWPVVLEYQVEFWVELPIRYGSTQPCVYDSSIGGAVRVSNGKANVVATMAPPRRVEIDGHLAGEQAMNVGRTPLLKWQPPENARPTGYRLQVYTATAISDLGCTVAEGPELFTTEHEARFPPGVVQPGKFNFVVVRAIYDAAPDQSPIFPSTTSSYAEALSAMFMP